MPFISMLIGLSFGSILSVNIIKKRSGIIIGFIVAVLLIVNVLSVAHKVSLMKENGYRATELLTELIPLIRQVPGKSTVFLVNPDPDLVKYSVFYLPGFHSLNNTAYYIKDILNRNDIEIFIIEHDQINEYNQIWKSIFFTIKENRITELQ